MTGEIEDHLWIVGNERYVSVKLCADVVRAVEEFWSDLMMSIVSILWTLGVPCSYIASSRGLSCIISWSVGCGLLPLVRDFLFCLLDHKCCFSEVLECPESYVALQGFRQWEQSFGWTHLMDCFRCLRHVCWSTPLQNGWHLCSGRSQDHRLSFSYMWLPEHEVVDVVVLVVVCNDEVQTSFCIIEVMSDESLWECILYHLV